MKQLGKNKKMNRVETKPNNFKDFQLCVLERENVKREITL